MSKKVYVCKECGNVFRPELSKHIENNIQVYCEMCGTPFILEGINFQYKGFNRKDFAEAPAIKTTVKRKDSLVGVIKFFNSIAFLPILIFAIVVLARLPFEIFTNLSEWGPILISRSFLGVASLSIALYDILYIIPNVKKNNYEKIVVDSFCFGILGCVIYGTGVIILIKGFFIIVKVILEKKNTENKIYSLGQNVKTSLNNFSSFAGIIIIFMLIWRFVDYGMNYETYIYISIPSEQFINPFNSFPAQLILFFSMIFVVCIFLILDISMYDTLRKKTNFTFGDSVKVFIIGVCSTIVFAVGIFILLKGILIFFLFVGKPVEVHKEKYFKETYQEPKYPSNEFREKPTSDQEVAFKEQRRIPPTTISTQMSEGSTKDHVLRVDQVKPHPPKISEEPSISTDRKDITFKLKTRQALPSKKREELIELKLHESLLPVRNEKDKKIVKEYFKKIFNVISKDIRSNIKELKISNKEKKELLKELAFLSKEEQLKYIEALVTLYQAIPKLLIERIKKIPKIKPEHYTKIISQLKYMDSDEQLEYVQFLEKNA